MKKALIVVLFFTISLLSLPITPVHASEDIDIVIYYFYVEECKHCKEVSLILDQLEEEYPLEVYSFEIGINESNRDLFEDFMQAYEVPVRDVPALFISNESIIGSDSTQKNIEGAIKNSKAFIDPLSIVEEWNNKKETTEERLDLTLSLVVLTALVDGVNPCTFAVLILLLSYLLSVKTKRGVLTIGLSFTASVFVTYLLVGLGIIEYFIFSDAIEMIRYIIIIVAISAGVINIKDFYQDKATLAIPSFAKPTISSLGKNAAVPSAIALGFFATLVELPCTGGIYLPILTLLAKEPSKAIFYLLIYNMLYILPLLVIIAITYRGISLEDVEGWRMGKRKYMRLIGGSVMLCIGLGMLIGII